MVQFNISASLLSVRISGDLVPDSYLAIVPLETPSNEAK